MKPLRILHVTHQYRPALGGSEQHVTHISEELARRGHEVHVYTTRSLDYRTWENELPRYKMLDGVHVHRFTSLRRGRLTHRVLERAFSGYHRRRADRYEPLILYGSGPIAPGLFWALLRRGGSFDVIHANTLPYAHVWYTWRAVQRHGTPLVITPFIHTQQADIFDVAPFNRALCGADRVMAMTNTEREYLVVRGINPDRIVMSGVGIKPRAARPVTSGNWRTRFGVPEDAFAVLFLGRRASYKGLDTLLEAFGRLQELEPRAHLLLAGPSTPYWERLWPRYHDLPHVIDCGRVSDQDKGRLIDACDVLVLPSTGESFGIVFLEAWMLEKPVIGADSGALADMVAHGQDGYLFAPGDAEELAQRLRRLSQDPALGQRLGRTGYQKVVQKYTVTRVTDQIERVYQELAGSTDVASEDRSHKHEEDSHSISKGSDEEKPMRVSLLNLNLVGRDAVGRSMMDKARFFQARGDQVRFYVQHVAEDVPADIRPLCVTCTLAQLIGNSPELAAAREHFYTSDLYVYDYPIWYELLETMRGIDRGVVILDYHGVTPPELWGSEEALDLLHRSVEELPELLRYADYAIGHSLFTRNELLEQGFDVTKTFSFPYAIPLADFTPGEKDQTLAEKYGLEGKQVLLYVGRMAGNKRVDLLVEALPLIQQQHPEAALLLVGDNEATAFAPIVAEIEDKIKALGLEEDVVFTGRVDDLPAHYRLADVYVTSSLHEGFCVPLIESMSVGLPIVASDTTAIPYTMEDAGLCFEPANVEDLAEHVSALLDNDELAEELQTRGFERAKAFSLEAFHDNWRRVLDEVLTHQPGMTAVAAPAVTAQPTEPAASKKSPSKRNQDSEALVSLPDQSEHYRQVETMGDISMHDYVVRSRLPVIGPLIAWIRRNLTSHLREPYVDPIIDRQVHVNRRLVWNIRDTYNKLREAVATWGEALTRLETKQEGLRADLQHNLDDLAQQQTELAAGIAAMRERLQEQQAGQKARTARDGRLWDTLEKLKSRQAGMTTRQRILASQYHDLQRLLEETPQGIGRDIQALREALAQLSGQELEMIRALETDAESAQPDEAFNYFLLADAAGGGSHAADLLRELYGPLVEHFRHAPDVVDLGCGTGVFLELLQEAGIDSYGVDLDEDAILLCKKKGLDVRQEDLISHLRSLPDKSLGGVFAAHVIEHLHTKELGEFLRLCHAKMLYGAPIVLVTPNAAALSIFYATFYKDLTHKKPIHPDTLQFLLETNGFRHTELDFISPMPGSFKLDTLNENLAATEDQRQWAETMNRNLEKMNQLLYGNLDCVISGLK